MKTLTRTIIIFLALNLITAGFAVAQPVPTPSESVPPMSSTNPPQERAVAETDRLFSALSMSTGRRSARAGSGNAVLVIPTEEMETEDLLTINEDMNVMSRIFENGLQQANVRTVGRSPYGVDSYMSEFMRRSRQTTQSMYLQGYGALFLMNVDFPLSAPPDLQEQEKEVTEEENVDQVWAATREQIFEPQETNRRRRGAERQEVKYDAEKVENLKTSLIQALKHAANIRALKTDESVILSITGIGISSGKIISAVAIPGTDEILVSQESGGKKITTLYKKGAFDEFELASPTMLVIRAKKSDIDTFAKGDLDLDKFRERVAILSYPLLGGNVAGASTSLILPTRPGTGIR